MSRPGYEAAKRRNLRRKKKASAIPIRTNLEQAIASAGL